jgi:hypothetical protein
MDAQEDTGCEGLTCAMINALLFHPESLFIGVVRGLITMFEYLPLTTLFTLSTQL